MSGLNQKDMDVLRYYADQGSRERYWNYLAQHEGSDGYGLLALGVVRNDNMPGAVANAYAQDYAREHNGVVLSDRQWESFGRDLVKEDLAHRQKYFDLGKTDLALNLPATDVQEAHMATFNEKRIDANAWTPNILIDAARRSGGEKEVEKVWHGMLDNSHLGLDRMGKTTWNIASSYRDQMASPGAYYGALTKADLMAMATSPQVDPDHIRQGVQHYEYDAKGKTWTTYVDTDVAEFGFRSPSERVMDSKKLDELNDARAIRLERQALSKNIHPDDQHHSIVKSPRTIADANVPEGDTRLAETARSIDPALYDDLKRRLPEGVSEDRLAQVTLATKQADIRAGEVAGLSVQDDKTLQIHGSRPGGRAYVDLSMPPPAVGQSVQMAEAHAQQQASNAGQFQAQQAQVEAHAQQQQALAQQGPSMGGPRFG